VFSRKDGPWLLGSTAFAAPREKGEGEGDGGGGGEMRAFNLAIQKRRSCCLGERVAQLRHTSQNTYMLSTSNNQQL